MSRCTLALTVWLAGAAAIAAEAAPDRSDAAADDAESPPAEVPPGAVPPGELPPAGSPPAEVPALALPEDARSGWGEALIARYYEGIQQRPAEAELQQARDSVHALLAGGVSVQRVEAAVARALFLHVPGRAVPFHIAVPLRIEGELPPPAPGGTLLEGSAAPVDPAVGQALAERRALLDQRRARLRLYDQWRDRTRAQRTLLTAGVPATAAGYILGYVGAVARYNQGLDTPGIAWAAAIPLVGSPIHLGLTGDPNLIGPMALQLGGWAAVIPGLAIKNRWPYKDDPQALLLPTPGGFTVAGRF